MKIAIAITSLVFLVTVGHAIAQITPLTYSEIVKEARRYETVDEKDAYTPYVAACLSAAARTQAHQLLKELE